MIYGLTDELEEIDLFKRIEIEKDGKREVEEIELLHLDNETLENVKKILVNKKEMEAALNDFSIMTEDNTRKITFEKYDYLISQKYDFSEKLVLLKEANRKIVTTNASLTIDELINYDRIFSDFSSNGDYAIYMLWLMERHLIFEKDIAAIAKIDVHMTEILAFLAAKIKRADMIQEETPKELFLRPNI